MNHAVISTCIDSTDLVSRDSAIRDTQQYFNKVRGYSSSPGIVIDGFRKVSFRITTDFISAVESLALKKLIALDTISNDSAWIMPAMEKKVGEQGENRWDVVHYFACYSLVNGKKDTAIYFKIQPNQNVLKAIPGQLAKNNIDSLYKYRQRFFNPQKIFCPKGFGLPWCDSYNIFKSAKKHPGAKIKGIMAIKNPAKDSITLFLYTNKLPKPKNSSGKNASGGDDDGYYDFMFPCPNSCIP